MGVHGISRSMSEKLKWKGEGSIGDSTRADVAEVIAGERGKMKLLNDEDGMDLAWIVMIPLCPGNDEGNEWPESERDIRMS